MKDSLDFLRETTPFNLLPVAELERLSQEMVYRNFERKQVLFHQHKSKLSEIHVIASGAYTQYVIDREKNKKHLKQISTGAFFDVSSILLNKEFSFYTVEVKKGTEILTLPIEQFKDLCQAYPDFYHYFLREIGQLLLENKVQDFQHFEKQEDEISSFDKYFNRQIQSLALSPIVRFHPQTPIYQVAEAMNYHKLGCVFIEENNQLIGYVTDITMRDKVVAGQRHSHEPVVNILESPISYIPSHTYVYEAILSMFRNKIRYLVVEEDEQAIGLISRNKLLTDQAESPLIFIQSVRQSNSIPELKKKWEEVPEVVYQLLNRGVNATLVNQVITAISDSIAYKVIEKAIDQCGEPPVEFVFMALGSEGRKEQTLKTDQDNALIYEDKIDGDRTAIRNYFLKFTERISEDLDFIGFKFCTGGFMAKNPKWTHSLSHWKENYDRWIGKPDAESIMNFSTFFDCRIIFGQLELLTELQKHIIQKLETPSGYFFAQLANNALQYEPPLTFFKNIKTISKGENKVFNIKHAMTPIVDLVRAYALKYQILRTNTGSRLLELKNLGVFTESEYNELVHAYYYLMALRLKHQAHEIYREKKEADNYINPEWLTKVEQVTLTEIFKVIENFQNKIKVQFLRKLY